MTQLKTSSAKVRYSSRHQQQKRDTAQDISNANVTVLTEFWAMASTNHSNAWESERGPTEHETLECHTWDEVSHTTFILQDSKHMPWHLSRPLGTPLVCANDIQTCINATLVHFSFAQSNTHKNKRRGQPLQQFFKTCRCQPLRQMRPDSINL